MSFKASLICIKSVTQSSFDETLQDKWQKCLIQIDHEITKIKHNLQHSIIISLPYNLQQIHQSIEQSLRYEIPQNVFDVLAEFMIPNKQFIESQIESYSKYGITETMILSDNDNDDNNDNINDRWTANKHDQLLQNEAIIIIDPFTQRFTSIPRYILGLHPDQVGDKTNHWKISWDRSITNYESKNRIFSIIGHYIANIWFIDYFHLSGDWTLKTDFTDALEVEYLCDDGQIANAEVIKQNTFDQKIFVHYNTSSGVRGKKCEWLNVPNIHLCGPKQDKLDKITKFRDLTSFYCNAPSNIKGTKRRRTRNQNDVDLQRAIAASLGQTYNDNDHGMKRQRVEDGEDLQRAIAASLGQTYDGQRSKVKDDRNDITSSDNISHDVERRDIGNNNGGVTAALGGNNGNTSNSGVFGGSYVNWGDEDDLLQRAIAESLRMQQ